MRVEDHPTALHAVERRMRRGLVLRRAAYLVSCALLLGAAFVCPRASTLSTSSAWAVAQQFDPEGEFNVEGSVPKGLAEVSTIQLLRDASRSFMNSHSGLYTNRGVTYRFKTLSVTRERFTFTTVALGGVSYSFTGRFLRGGVFAELDSDQWGKPILVGQLSRFRGRRKEAVASLKFSYFGGT
ncbi:MAG TPA: hypothetical protein VF553_05530 [Pyrinomonadaceae bacterium]|jgi:hypothetical protein